MILVVDPELVVFSRILGLLSLFFFWGLLRPFPAAGEFKKCSSNCERTVISQNLLQSELSMPEPNRHKVALNSSQY